MPRFFLPLKRLFATRWGIGGVYALIAAGPLWFAVAYGTFAAADTDPYGYVSQAELIASGAIKIDVRFAWDLPWPAADSSYVPPGFTLSKPRGFAVPTYPSGLPLVMAGLLRLTGDRSAVFYVVPLLAALGVWTTGWLGARLHGPLLGGLAAGLLATSPILLHQSQQPVSDVPAASWWTVALTLALGRSRLSALMSGLAASMAVLTRPNLAPLVATIGAYLLWRARDPASDAQRRPWVNLALFVAGVAPGCLAVGAINAYLFGSPLTSGYGALSDLYAWDSVLPNLARYPRWLVESHTPIIVLALFAPWIAPRARAELWLLVAFAGLVVSAYLPWGVFRWDEWGYVRFILPAVPPLIVASLIVPSAILDRLVSPRLHNPLWLSHSRFAVVVTVLVAVAWGLWQAADSVRRGVTTFPLVERRYVDVARYIALAMPPDAVYLASLHAGSIRYHAGRTTVHFGRLHEESLDTAVAGLVSKGHQPFIVVEAGEEAAFRARFQANNALGALDWPPKLALSEGLPVHVYDPADRDRYLAGTPIVTYDMLQRTKPRVTTMGR